MQIYTNEIPERQKVLSNVVRRISEMPDETLVRVLSFVREIEDVARIGGVDCKRLSNREKEVLTLIANGYSRKQVGTSLGISSNTAARHISTIYTKLGVSSIAEATRYAIRNGLA